MSISLKTSHIISILTIACFLLILTVSAGKAQKRQKLATTEDIAIAFYKTGGVIPNFENWIRKRLPYKETPAARRPEVMEQQQTRLQNAYQNFNPNKDFLKIRSFVHITPQTKTDKTGKETYNVSIRFIEAPDALYFPYDFLGERIVVMPYSLEKLMRSEISKSEYDFISRTVKQSPRKHKMTIRLKAREADLSRPYKIDGIDQWVFKTDIVSMEVWNNQNSLLWQYTAPWHVNPLTQELYQLRENRPKGSSEKGSVKPLILNQ